MPALSLVVCVHRERDVLERLLRETAGLSDDLVVVHDGPENTAATQIHSPDEIMARPPAIDYAELSFDSDLPTGYNVPSLPPQRGSIHELAAEHNGRYWEGLRCFQQEPHWPFAWSRAQYDWILRLDADEFPSKELKTWLRQFRNQPEPATDVSAYTCVWPVWNGKKTLTARWPSGRIFLFHRRRVRFFGVVEQVPLADNCYQPLPLVLHHEPRRKSHGLVNVLRRTQGARWRFVIVQSLLGTPDELPRWRWSSENWPERWEEVRRHPLKTALSRLIFDSLRTFRDEWKAESRIHFGIGVSGPIHHALFCVQFWRLRRAFFQRNKRNGS